MKKIFAILVLIGVTSLVLNYPVYSGWGDPPIEPDDSRDSRTDLQL